MANQVVILGWFPTLDNIFNLFINMTLIEILEKNEHYEGKLVFLGCSNYEVTEVFYENMVDKNLERRDTDFYLPKNLRGWQKWNDVNVSIINNFEKKSTLNKINNLLEVDYKGIGNVGILVVEAPNPEGAVQLIHKIKPQMKKSGLIIISYKSKNKQAFQDKIIHEFDSQDLGHTDKFSYIKFIQGKTPLNKFKKVGRTRSIMT